MLARRHAVVVASPADPGLTAPPTRAAGDRGATSPAPRSRRRSGPRAPAPPRSSAPRAPRCVEAPADRSRAPASPPTCARRRGPGLSAAAPHHQAPEHRGQPDADRELHPQRQPEPGQKPSANPHRTSHGAVPERDLDRLPRLDHQRPRPRGRGPGRDQRPAHPQPGDAADDDARQLQRPVRGDAGAGTRRRCRRRTPARRRPRGSSR